MLNRRDFLKALGLTTTATAASACGWDTNRYKTPVENILPYVVKPDQVTPGTPTFFATSVLRGPAAHPVTARHRDGRVIFVSANFEAPARPAVPSAALFELQKHYSPDRIQGPTDGGAETTWDAGLSKLADAIKAAKGAGKQVAFLGSYRSGAIVDLIDDVTDDHAVYWEPAGYEAEALAAEKLFGKRVLPHYDLGKADYVLSFGAPFLSGWGNTALEGGYATGRDPNVDHTVARFALVAPLRDATGANADDWYGAKAGSETLVARAIAGIVADKKGAAKVKALVGSVTPEEAAEASGLSVEDITAIAEHFASGHGVALPGGASGDTDLAAATYLINVAADPEGERFHLGGYQGPISTWAEVSALLDDLNAGKIGVLLVDDLDLTYALPADSGAAAALQKADLLVSLSSHPDGTTKLAGLSLPTSDAFEDWGDETPRAGLRLMRQPAMSALYDTRSLGDVLLASARAAGLTTAATAVAPATEGEGEAADAETSEDAPAPQIVAAGLGFAPETWQAYIQQFWERFVFDGGDFLGFWETSVISGFAELDAGDVRPALAAASYSFGPATDLTGDTILTVGIHPMRQDGRYANQPWAQEVPDPITGIVWDSWLEMSQAKAEQLGLSYNSQVEIKTEHGSATVGVYPRPGLRDDTVFLHLGQGHTDDGRYANGYGINAASLFSTQADAQGAFTWSPVAATLSKQSDDAGLVTAFSVFGMSSEGRAFGVHVNADKLAEHGDAPADHPGELTGIHHLELDERLTERGITDFYPVPEHSTYRFAMTVDTNACTGCGACSVACYAENNLPIVGKDKVREGREMGWIRINRYWETDVGGEDDVRFVPMMCQHCGHAGCENVCPVLATYHNIDGLNAMVYNRCAGTRYCSNACPFSVRRFNYHTYSWPEPFNLQLNPDVSTRTMGVMEKCTFCVQRLRQTKSAYKDGGNFTRTVPHEAWEQVPACVEACPSQALTFGNLKDHESKVYKATQSPRRYQPLEELNVFSAVTYLAKANFHDDPSAHHGGGHGEAHADGHGEDDHHEEGAHGSDDHGADDGHKAEGH